MMNSLFKGQMEEAGGGRSRGGMIISVLFSVHGHAHKFSRSIFGLFWVMSSTSGACCGPKIRTIPTIIWYFSFLGGLNSGNMILVPRLSRSLPTHGSTMTANMNHTYAALEDSGHDNDEELSTSSIKIETCNKAKC